jgi:hypothetical protein
VIEDEEVVATVERISEIRIGYNRLSIRLAYEHIRIEPNIETNQKLNGNINAHVLSIDQLPTTTAYYKNTVPES